MFMQRGEALARADGCGGGGGDNSSTGCRARPLWPLCP